MNLGVDCYPFYVPLIDLNQQGFPSNYDVCVIGAGAAGITLALELSDAGQNVLLCEAGDRRFDAASQDAYQGELTGEKYYELITARMRYFGGTTNHWAGYCHPLQEIDFAPRNDLVVPGWPIAYEDIWPHYERAGQITDLPDNAWDFDGLKAAAQLPTILGADSGMDSLAFRWPREFKFRKLYLDQLIATPNVTIALNANLVDLEFGVASKFVSSAKFKNYNGDIYTASADKYVIACGGIENAKLLLNFADSHTELMDVAGNIGQYFMEHLCYYNSAYIITGKQEVEYLQKLVGGQPSDVGNYQWVAVPNADARAKHDLAANVSITLDDTRFFAPDTILADPVTKGVQSLMKNTKVSGSDQIIYCYLRGEQLPNPESNIQLSDQRDEQGLRRVTLNWGFDPRDLKSMVGTIGLFGQVMAKQDLGRVCMIPPDGLGQFTTIYGGYHHMGTTRMSETAEHGVVDTNCRVHGIDNLYMGGSSVFSTGGWANPTINVVAFAVRLAEHLKQV
jgi:choline dehydrogenase-like flavoprotein